LFPCSPVYWPGPLALHTFFFSSSLPLFFSSIFFPLARRLLVAKFSRSQGEARIMIGGPAIHRAFVAIFIPAKS